MNSPLTAAALLAGKSSIVPRISDAPAALASIALNLAAFFDKLSPADSPTLERGHELITWKDHPKLHIEVSGSDGKLELNGIWIGGIEATDYMASFILRDAVTYIEGLNEAHNLEQQHAAANNRADIINGK